MAAKLVLENGTEFNFNESCGIDGDTVTVDGKKFELDGTPKFKKVYSGLLTPDGTLLSSLNRHDYVTHEDANGNHYMLDGGIDYVRSSANGDEKYISLYENSPIEKIREVIGRSGYGADNAEDRSWRCALLKEMSNEWVSASIEYVHVEYLRDIYKRELEYRDSNSIYIEDSETTYHNSWESCKQNINVDILIKD